MPSFKVYLAILFGLSFRFWPSLYPSKLLTAEFG
jgi:hypothetical protein